MNTKTTDFSDLDDLDAQVVPAPAAKKTFLDAQAEFTQRAPQVKCPKCGGSGVKLYGYVNLSQYPCSFCKGTGMASADRQKRIDAFKKGLRTAQENRAAKRAAFVAAHPAEVKWIENTSERFDFARAMGEALNERGTLTEGQLAAVQRCLAKDAERAAAKVAAAPAVATGGVDKLKAALQKARDAKLKFARIVVDELTFTLAGEASRNPGAVYVKANGEYAGKVQDGRFLAAHGHAQLAERVQVVMLDPLAAAREYGLRTGTCSCCGRELTDPRSIERGIGPICESKYF